MNGVRNNYLFLVTETESILGLVDNALAGSTMSAVVLLATELVRN
jgi:hypothetical protein